MTEQARAEFLKSLPAFAKWSREDRIYLAGEMPEARFERGQIVFQAETLADDAYVVLEGSVRQSVKGAGGSEWYFRTLRPNELFAQQTLYRGRNYASTATAGDEGSTLLVIPARVLAWALTKHPDLWKKLLKSDVAGRLRAVPLFRSLTDVQIERLADTADFREFKAGEAVSSLSANDGAAWVVDQGQVEVTDSGQIDFNGSQVLRGHGYGLTEPIPPLTAGNWFLGGLVLTQRLDAATTLATRARTPARLIRVPAAVIESMEAHFPDVMDLLARVPLVSRLSLIAEGEEAQVVDLGMVETLRQNLGEVDYFQDLTAAHWKELAGYAGLQHVPDGQPVSRQGERSGNLFLLLGGAAVVRASDEQGRERPRHFLTPGAYFGHNSLLLGAKRDATVEVDNRVRQLGGQAWGADWLSLNRQDLLYMMALNPGLWRNTRLRKDLTDRPERHRFEWLQDEEEVKYEGRRHIIVYVEIVLAILAIAGAAILGLWGLDNAVLAEPSIAPLTYLLVALVLVGLLLILPTLNYFDDYYVVTNRRVTRRFRQLWLYETRVEAPLERIQDLTTDIDFIGRLIGYGNLIIRTAAVGGSLEFRQVPKPEEVREIIQEQRGRARAALRAERREVIRSDLINRLGQGMVPVLPARVLRDGMPWPPRNALERIWRTVKARWRAGWVWFLGLPGRFVAWLLSPFPEARARWQGRRRPAEKKREEETLTYRKHWLFLLRKIWLPTLAVVVTFILIFVEAGFEDLTGTFEELNFPLAAFCGLLPFLAALLWWGYQFENWRNDKYILTKTSIIDIEALPFGLAERKRQAEWDKVQNATYTVPSIWANIFNYGTVIIETASTFGQFDFINVGRPRLVQAEIFRRLEDARLAREARQEMERRADFTESLEIYHDLLRGSAWPG